MKTFARSTPKSAPAAHDPTELFATMKEIEARRAVVLQQVLKREAAGDHLNDEPPVQALEQRTAALSLLNGAAADIPRPKRGVTYKQLITELQTIDLALGEGSKIAFRLQLEAAQKRLETLAPEIAATMAEAAKHLFAAEKCFQKYDSLSRDVGYGLEKGAAAATAQFRLYNASSHICRLRIFRQAWLDRNQRGSCRAKECTRSSGDTGMKTRGTVYRIWADACMIVLDDKRRCVVAASDFKDAGAPYPSKLGQRFDFNLTEANGKARATNIVERVGLYGEVF
jgi:hypothetical protein